MCLGILPCASKTVLRKGLLPYLMDLSKGAKILGVNLRSHQPPLNLNWCYVFLQKQKKTIAWKTATLSTVETRSWIARIMIHEKTEKNGQIPNDLATLDYTFPTPWLWRRPIVPVLFTFPPLLSHRLREPLPLPKIDPTVCRKYRPDYCTQLYCNILKSWVLLLSQYLLFSVT